MLRSSMSRARFHVSLPSSPRACAWIAAVAAGLAAAPGLAEEVTLRLARELAPPAAKSGTVRLPQPAASPVPVLTAPREAEPPRGVVFLRADRLEGDASTVTAEGTVELRSRYETVLADWLSYDMVKDEIWAKGNVAIRRGFDWITGPELRYERATQLGAFTTPQFFVSEANGNGSASEIRFAGPDHYEVTDARYTTCIAPNHDWYLASEELEVDSLRKVGTARRASVYFMDVPVMYAPWLEFPLSNERKSGFLTPTFGSTGVRGFEASVPYYLNLAPNYDATITPRTMTKRGVQIGGQFRYLFGDAESQWGQAVGEANAEILPDDRVTHESRYALAWKHNQQFAPWLAGFVNLNKVSDDTYFADFADRVAITSQKTLPRDGGTGRHDGTMVAAHARAELPDVAGSEQPPVTPPYNRLPQVLATLNETEWRGLTWSGMAEYAKFAQECAGSHREPGSSSIRRMAWSGAARRGSSLRAQACIMRQYDLDQTTPCAAGQAPEHTDADHEPRRRARVRARRPQVFETPVVQTLEPRAFYVYIPYREPEPTRPCSTRRSTTSASRAVHREPLHRQRPHRRRQPAHAGPDVALPRSANRRRAPACRGRPALLFQGPAGHA